MPLRADEPTMNTLTIATDALPATLKRGQYTRAIAPTAKLVEESELMVWLAARLGRKASGVTGSVWRSSADSRRLFTGAQRARIIARDCECCAYCGQLTAEDDRYIDHVIPHCAGGQTVDANGVLACGSCNLAKSNKFW